MVIWSLAGILHKIARYPWLGIRRRELIQLGVCSGCVRKPVIATSVQKSKAAAEIQSVYRYTIEALHHLTSEGVNHGKELSRTVA